MNCNTYRSGSSFSDSHRSSLGCSSRCSSNISGYYDNHRSSPCSIRSSSSRNNCDCRNSYYSKHSTSSTNWTDGWIGHPLDPVGCIFDTLAEASLILDDNIPHTPSFFGKANPLKFEASEEFACYNWYRFVDPLNADETVIHIIPRYHHVAVVGSRDRTETYLTLAVEVALMALGQQRIMPPGLYAQVSCCTIGAVTLTRNEKNLVLITSRLRIQEKACKQEDRLIARLQEMEMDNNLIMVLRRQAIMLLEGGPSSGLGIGIHPESVPMHTFARFLFLYLLNYYPDLAYEVGLRAMRCVLRKFHCRRTAFQVLICRFFFHRLPILEDHEDADDPVNGNVSSLVLSRYPRWFTLGHIETQQCNLASTMLSAAKGWCSVLEKSTDLGFLSVMSSCCCRRSDETSNDPRVCSETHS